MTAVTPNVTGQVTTYSVSPTLPAGLAINTGSGAISGTPTAVQASTNYAVTAANAGGSTNATVAITVNDVVPSIAYPASAYTFTTGVPIQPIVPVATGGAIVQWTIDRALPAGVTFNTTNGQILGTPAQTAAAGNFVVSARNSGGTDTFALSVGVRSGVLLQLGHVGTLNDIVYQGTRILSADTGGGVALWNATSGELLANFNSGCSQNCIALAGPTVAVRYPDALELRTSSDGALLARLPAPAQNVSWWKLASDGSYIALGQGTGITVWSSAGVQLFVRDGTYQSAIAFAAAGELRVGGGPAGAHVIEKITVPGAASTSSAAFPATFHSWFADGDRFLTTAGNVVTVYSHDLVQQDIATLPTVVGLSGRGNWFHTHNAGSLRVYAVGSAATAAATFAVPDVDTVVAGNNTLGVLTYGAPQLSVIDLSGATPARADYTAPLGYLSAYASLSASEWVFGTSAGVLLGELNAGAPQRYSLGRAHSIVGSASRFAIATASGSIFHFDGETLAQQGEITFASTKLEMSADGTRLAASALASGAQYVTDETLRLYALPGGNLVSDWPYDFTGPTILLDYSLSGSGTVLARILLPSGGTRTQQVDAIAGAPVWFENNASGQPIRLAPNGAAHAVSSEGLTPVASTRIFVNGVLSTAATGWAVGWLDDNRLLINRFRYSNTPPAALFDGSVILDSTGQTLASPALPQMDRMQPLPANRLYSPRYNQIFDVATGAVLWSSPADAGPQQGAASDKFVVFASGATVRAEPR
jgi:WD40 repeat protein